MAGKVILVIFLAMFMFTEHSMANEGTDLTGFTWCIAKCAIKCKTDPICYAGCIAKCALSSDGLSDEDESGLRACNVGCSLGYCSKFLFQYDEKIFGTCMARCRENRCVEMIKMKA